MSFYILKLKQQNNRYDLYIYNNLQKIINNLYIFLSSNDGCYETIWLGIDIILERYTDNILVESLDLHQYIFYELNKYPQIYFDPYNSPILIDHNNNSCELNDEYDEYFCSNVLNGDENINVYISSVNINELSGKLIDKDDIIIIDNIRYHYGYNNGFNTTFFSDTDDISTISSSNSSLSIE